MLLIRQNRRVKYPVKFINARINDDIEIKVDHPIEDTVNMEIVRSHQRVNTGVVHRQILIMRKEEGIKIDIEMKTEAENVKDEKKNVVVRKKCNYTQMILLSRN